VAELLYYIWYIQRMAGNPKDSKWRSVPRAERGRKGVEIMLGEEARAKLERLVQKHELRTKSAVVEDLILEAEEK
jgi:hypothetical protein